MTDLTAVLLVWIPFAFIAYNWLLFPALLMLAVRLRPAERTPARAIGLPFVTIAIAAWNEEKCIGEKIANCLDLRYPADRMLVIVGSDGSDDRTDSIVRSHAGARVHLLRLEKRSGKPSVLNALMHEAVGELVLFTDADVMLDPGALESMVARFDDPSVGAVHPDYRRVNSRGSPAEGAFDRYEAMLKNLEGKLGAMVGAYGWALMVRRDLCEDLPIDTVLDDFLIGVRPFRRGYSVVYEPAAMCWSSVEDERIEFARKVRISRGNVQALFRNVDLLSPRYGVKAWVLFSHKFLRWITPFLMLSMLVGSALSWHVSFFRVALLLQLLAFLTMPLVLVARGPLRRLLILQYYIWTNLALLVGYWQYFFVRKPAYNWLRTARG
jgi:cellulose synthase/poly-beta-1,6-N-acetylglucosamine synthase-like glycosyltransferase